MHSLAVGFLVVSIIAAILGFGAIASSSTWIAQVLFLVFLALFVISLIFARRAPRL